MKLTEPLPLNHSWPLFECDQQFDLGCVLDPEDRPLLPTDMPTCAERSAVERTFADWGVGQWQCDLANNSLTWSAETYAIFGFPPGADVTRAETVALYREESRAAMERLRAYAIRHRRGFTLDAEILPVRGAARWMRLMAAPLCEGDKAVRLFGLKRDVTALYR